jgi:hypothetical protein
VPEKVMKHGPGLIDKAEPVVVIVEELGDGRVPLLAEGRGIPHAILACRLPVGKRVEVEGLMMLYGLLAPAGTSLQGGGVSRVTPEDGVFHGQEHQLLIRGSLKELRD